ncbi:MAG TPA: AAA family ATPase [Gaiellaceae bacterium]
MGSTVVGREAERAEAEAFVTAVPEGARALVLGGEPGIGKTALWWDAVERCRAAGCETLIARPAEEEMPEALGGLRDLFERVGAGPLLRGGDDPLARGRAVLARLRGLAEERPLVLAIDDVQWLDPASARTLRYALRRLDRELVGLVVTVRSGEDDPLQLAATFAPERRQSIELGPLDLDELRALLGGTVATISRPLLRRIHEVSGGNPLYAVELARSLAGARRAARLELPDSLQAAISQRLEHAPRELVPVLEAAAALGPAPVSALQRALPSDVDLDSLLAAAEEQGLLVVEAELEVRFTHALLGSAVYARLTPVARHALHARLAAAARDDDARARHLALSTDEPDADVAALLERAAARARERGASDLAADFARHSLRLTPPDDEDGARRRALAEIIHLAAAGEAGRALELADALVERLPAGPGRAEALVQRFYVGNDPLEVGDALLVRALDEADGDELLRGRVLDLLGWVRGMFSGRVQDGIACGREAVAVAERLGDRPLEMIASAHLAHMEAVGGAPRPELMDTAIELAEELGGPLLGGGPHAWLAKQRFWAGDLAGARGLLDAALAADARSGNELERPYRLYDLALLECAAGDLAAAAAHVQSGIEAARDAENADAEGWLLFPLGLVEAWLGRAAPARAAAGQLLDWAERRSALPWIVRARSIVGLLALSQDDVTAAAEELSQAARLLEEMGFAHPGALPALPDAVEALARSGDVDTAALLLERLERQAAAVGSAWASAAAERARGVELLARGDADGAAPLLERAAASFDRLGYRPGAARSVLGRGRALLRAGQRRLAAEALAEARNRFGALGAGLWEARAAEELERAAPGRPGGDLTAAERRIAALVAEGRKNREIAQTLFMSAATVEAHLTRIYRKLDLRGRSELTRLVVDGSIELH